MKFIVCIKQVPDVTSPLQLDEGDVNADAGRFVLNAYDASALEAALTLSEAHGGTVHLVLVGPPRAQETIRKALAMGADSAMHIRVDANGQLDSRGYAQILFDHLRDEAFDVLACGKQAQDTDAGLTGPMLAELLGRPFSVNAVGLDVDGDQLVVTREGDAGREIVALETPCVVSCSNDVSDPRIPNLKGIMAAKRKAIDVRTAASPTGFTGTRVRRYEEVAQRRPGRILEGEVDEVVGELVALLKNEADVL